MITFTVSSGPTVDTCIVRDSHTGKTMEFGCPADTIIAGGIAYHEGELIQDAFPSLNADEREFLLSGLTPEEFDALFCDED